ncbi:hypothetical protein ACLB2K_036970 [Fragaria x ananassa]
MVGSQPTQDTDSAPSMKQVSQMFAQLTGQIQSLTTHVADLTGKFDGLTGKVDDLAEHVKRDKTLWEADQHNLAILTEDFNRFAGEVKEDKDVVNGSLQWIQKDLNQNTEILSLTRATIDEQTRRLDDHDAKMHDQHNASFFGSKNGLEKLEEVKEKRTV